MRWSPTSGLTQDRQYGKGRLDQTSFLVIDTGHYGYEEGIDRDGRAALRAIEEASLRLFIWMPETAA